MQSGLPQTRQQGKSHKFTKTDLGNIQLLCNIFATGNNLSDPQFPHLENEKVKLNYLYISH